MDGGRTLLGLSSGVSLGVSLGLLLSLPLDLPLVLEGDSVSCRFLTTTRPEELPPPSFDDSNDEGHSGSVEGVGRVSARCG